MSVFYSVLPTECWVGQHPWYSISREYVRSEVLYILVGAVAMCTISVAMWFCHCCHLNVVLSSCHCCLLNLHIFSEAHGFYLALSWMIPIYEHIVHSRWRSGLELWPFHYLFSQTNHLCSTVVVVLIQSQDSNVKIPVIDSNVSQDSNVKKVVGGIGGRWRWCKME